MNVPMLGDSIHILAPEGERWGTLACWPKNSDWIWIAYPEGKMLIHSARLVNVEEGKWEDSVLLTFKARAT